MTLSLPRECRLQTTCIHRAMSCMMCCHLHLPRLNYVVCLEVRGEIIKTVLCCIPRVGPGHPSFPLSIYFSSFPLFTFLFLSLALLIFFFCPSLLFLPEQSHSVSRPEVVGSDRIWVQFVVFNLCYQYSLVTMDSGVLFYLVQFSFVCSFSALTLLVGSFDP